MGDATEALLGLVEASTEWRNVARMGRSMAGESHYYRGDILFINVTLIKSGKISAKQLSSAR